MNNDLAQFSEERLKQIIDLSKFTGGEETLALARIALAAKQAKPVAYLIHEKGGDTQLRFHGLDAIRKCDIEEHELWQEQLYTTPQPAHTEQDGWKLVPEEATIAMLTLLGLTGSFSSMQQKYQNMLDAAPMHDAFLTNEDAKSDGWIKCSERMPPSSEPVWAYAQPGFEYAVEAYWDGDWYRTLTDEPEYSITHWMPLPQPPVAAHKPESD